MNISPAPNLERADRRQVESGPYPSVDEVLHEASQLLDNRDHLRTTWLEELREEIAIGLRPPQRGEVTPPDMGSVRATVGLDLTR